MDLFIARINYNLLLNSNGDGTFSKVSNEVFVNRFLSYSSTAWCDYDKDGYLDLFVTAISNQPNLLNRNKGGEKNWINIKLKGTISNRYAIGAKIKTSYSNQLQVVSTHSGQGGQSGYGIHFGIGSANSVSIYIEWPSGIVQTLQNVPANQSIEVTESGQSLDLGEDLTVCSQSGITLQATAGFDTYRWQDGSTGTSFVATQSGKYWVQAFRGCTYVTDTIQVSILKVPNLNLGSDHIVCEQKEFVIKATDGFASYVWQDGSTGIDFKATLSGKYWVTAFLSPCGTFSDTINLVFNPKPKLNLGNDTTLCEGESIILEPGIYDEYFWSNSTHAPTLKVSKAGKYSLTVTKNGCQTTDSIKVNYLKAPFFSLGQDTLVCNNSYLVLNAGGGNANYLWQYGSTDPIYVPKVTGSYSVKVSNRCGTFTNEILVNFITPKDLLPPNVITPNSDCVNDTFIINAFLRNPPLIIYNRWGKPVYSSTNYKNDWSGDHLAPEVYFYRIEHQENCIPSPINGWVHILK